jgi:hypothetical protein
MAVMGENPKWRATFSGKAATNGGMRREGIRFQRCTVRTQGRGRGRENPRRYGKKPEDWAYRKFFPGCHRRVKNAIT